MFFASTPKTLDHASLSVQVLDCNLLGTVVTTVVLVVLVFENDKVVVEVVSCKSN